MNLKQGENESKFDYIKRLTLAKRDKSNDLDYSEWSNLCFDKEYSSDVARRMFYGIEKLLEVIESENMINISEDDMLKQMNDKKKELEILTCQFQDQKREYKNYLRADARFEHLKNEMVKAINNSNKVYINKYVPMGKIKCNSASLILSDWHLGMQIYDELNVFNKEVLVNRVNTLASKTIEYCELHNVKELNIELLGDLVQGYLHNSSRCLNEEDVITQTIKVSEIIAELIDTLAVYVPQINIFSCTGNHGRCSANIKDSLQVENFERLVTWHLQTSLKCKNVKVFDCQNDMIKYTNLKEVNIVSAHGNLDKPTQVVNNFIKMYKYVPDEIHLGHTHFYQENDEYDINVVVNGSLSGLDDFAKSIRKYSVPCQVLRIYGDDVCTYKIKLYE